MSNEWFCAEQRADGVIVVSGDLDAVTAEPLRAAITGFDAPLRLDLEGVSFIDSVALHVLVAVRERLGDGFQIVATSAVVRRLFQLTGLTTTLLGPADRHPNA